MAIINKVEQRAYLGNIAIIKFQLLAYCFFKNITISGQELECLALLAKEKESELNVFCHFVGEKELYASAQSVRNVLNKFEKKGLIIKTGKKNKVVRLNSAMNLQTEGNILLDYKFAHLHETSQI